MFTLDLFMTRVDFYAYWYHKVLITYIYYFFTIFFSARRNTVNKFREKYLWIQDSWKYVMSTLLKKTCISFSSSNTQFYKTPKFCLFTFWVFFPDKSFKFIFEIHPKMPITVILKRKKNTLCNTLNWGNWNSGFVKIGSSMSWTRYN